MRSSKVWNFSTVKPPHPTPPHPTLCPTTPTYQVNHTCALSHFPLSVSLSVPHAHKLTFIHCFTLSQLPLHSVAQTSYTSAGSSAPLGPRHWRCTAEGPLQIFSVISHAFLSYSPSLACLGLLSLHSCCHSRFYPLLSPCYEIANFSLYCFSLGKDLSFFVLPCPNHAFPSPSINKLLFPASSGVSDHSR